MISNSVLMYSLLDRPFLDKNLSEGCMLTPTSDLKKKRKERVAQKEFLQTTSDLKLGRNNYSEKLALE